MGKQDIIEIAENSIKRTMVAETKFQNKHKSTGIPFNPVKPRKVFCVDYDENLIVNMLYEYVAHGLAIWFEDNLEYIAYECSVPVSVVRTYYNLHRAYILGEL